MFGPVPSVGSDLLVTKAIGRPYRLRTRCDVPSAHRSSASSSTPLISQIGLHTPVGGVSSGTRARLWRRLAMLRMMFQVVLAFEHGSLIVPLRFDCDLPHRSAPMRPRLPSSVAMFLSTASHCKRFARFVTTLRLLVSHTFEFEPGTHSLIFQASDNKSQSSPTQSMLKYGSPDPTIPPLLQFANVNRRVILRFKISPRAGVSN
mmetsp:Transcript_51458/g.71400  ORF Transcript_51458/g.71400 Transcript_51458/m.71400 type:complete len:204 (+) Transcript_51458:999-1610(+)